MRHGGTKVHISGDHSHVYEVHANMYLVHCCLDVDLP